MMAELFDDMGLIDWFGILGSVIIASAYFAVSQKLVDATRPAFHLLNLTGAGLILLSLYFRPNAGAIMIEVLWVAIALYSLAKYAWRGR
jgi:hypothetical protein